MGGHTFPVTHGVGATAGGTFSLPMFRVAQQFHIMQCHFSGGVTTYEATRG